MSADSESSAIPVTIPPKQPRRFSLSIPYDIALPDPDNTETGQKIISVRFPTNEEWCKHRRSIVDVQRASGSQRKGEVEADLELVKAIRIDASDPSDDDPGLDEFETSRILDQLRTCVVTEVEKIGNTYHIEMRVVGGIKVSHSLRIMSQRQIMEYGKAAVKTKSTRNSVENRVLLEASEDYWNKLHADESGYADPNPALIPVIHKDAALLELLLQQRNEISGGDDPED